MYKIRKGREGFFVAVDKEHKTEEICSSMDRVSSVRISSAPIWYVTEFSIDEIVSIIEKVIIIDLLKGILNLKIQT